MLTYTEFEYFVNCIKNDMDYINKCRTIIGREISEKPMCFYSLFWLLQDMLFDDCDDDILHMWIFERDFESFQYSIDAEETVYVKTARDVYEIIARNKEKNKELMTCERFVKYLTNIKEHNSFIEKCRIVLKWDMFECLKCQDALIKLLQKHFADKDEFLSWWIYEKEYGTRDDINAYSKDGNIIPLDTVEQIYAFLRKAYYGKIHNV